MIKQNDKALKIGNGETLIYIYEEMQMYFPELISPWIKYQWWIEEIKKKLYLKFWTNKSCIGFSFLILNSTL